MPPVIAVPSVAVAFHSETGIGSLDDHVDPVTADNVLHPYPLVSPSENSPYDVSLKLRLAFLLKPGQLNFDASRRLAVTNERRAPVALRKSIGVNGVNNPHLIPGTGRGNVQSPLRRPTGHGPDPASRLVRICCHHRRQDHDVAFVALKVRWLTASDPTLAHHLRAEMVKEHRPNVLRLR